MPGYRPTEIPIGHKTQKYIRDALASEGIVARKGEITGLFRKRKFPDSRFIRTPSGQKVRIVPEEQARMVIQLIKEQRALEENYLTREQIIRNGKDFGIRVSKKLFRNIVEKGLIGGVIKSHRANTVVFLVPKAQLFNILFRALQASVRKTPGFLTPNEAERIIKQHGGNLAAWTIKKMAQSGKIFRVAQYMTGNNKPNWLIHESEMPKLIEYGKSQQAIGGKFMEHTRVEKMSQPQAVTLARDLAQARRTKALYSFSEASTKLGITHQALDRMKPNIMNIAGQKYVSDKEVRRLQARMGIRKIREMHTKSKS